MPVVSRILESYLWVKNAERAAEFYKDLFGFEVIGRSSELASTITSVLALRSFGCRFYRPAKSRVLTNSNCRTLCPVQEWNWRCLRKDFELAR